MKEDQKIVIYQTEDGQTQIDVRLENETVWLTQAQMTELFQKDKSVIARHINNALKEGELEENSNMHFLHNTQYKYRPTKIYDLDTIICVCYRFPYLVAQDNQGRDGEGGGEPDKPAERLSNILKRY